VSEGDYVAANTKVRIEQVDGAKIMVRPLKLG
jgi:membrane protein implicated in regulation of membrane protease activity